MKKINKSNNQSLVGLEENSIEIIPNVKILIAYHKIDNLYKDELLTPINGGRTLIEGKNNPEQKWLFENTIGDNTGENISIKNPLYNELTAIYWAWKNYNEIGNPSHLGFMHYRRHFLFNNNTTLSCKIHEEREYDISKDSGYSPEIVNKLVAKYDFVCNKAFYRHTVYTHYKENHDIKDLDKVLEILSKKYPEFHQSAQKYINGDNSYFFNMFIFPQKIFFQYCEWIFSILEEFEKTENLEGKRLFVSERLTGIFIQHLIDLGLNGAFIPTIYIEGQHTIPILLSTSEEYALPTTITMISILENAKKNTFINFHILIPHAFPGFISKYFETTFSKYINCRIVFSIMGNEFDSAYMADSHIACPTYYRLLAPTLFPQYNKIIYLDSDIIVNSDLTSYYDLSIDDFLVSGVKAPAYHMYSLEHAEVYKKLSDIKSLDQYINAGAIVMNLKKMRELNLVGEFIELSKKRHPSMDQDILNKVCYGRIRILPLKYNNMISKYQNEKEELLKIFGEIEVAEAEDKPVIIHYCDKIKPWVKKDCYKGEVWWKYAKLSPFVGELINALKIHNLQIPNAEKTKRQVNPKISVIIPIFNMEQFLPQCLNTVLAQTLKEIEILCINDGSKDNSINILNRYAEEDPRIIVVTQSNTGVGEARNLGIGLAKGEFLAFLDPDDYYPDKYVLARLYEKAKSNNADVVGGSFCEDHNGVIKSNFREELQNYIFKKEGFVDYLDHQWDFGYARFIYSRKMIKNNKILFPNYSRFQDPPFFVAAMVVAKGFYAIPEFVYCYRYGHKEIKWEYKKINDFLKGIIDNLRMSGNNKLAKLHLTTLNRINNEYYGRIINVVNSGNLETIDLLMRANTQVDTKLLSSIGIEKQTVLPVKALRYILQMAGIYTEKDLLILDETLGDNYGINNKIILEQAQKIKFLTNQIESINKSISYKLGRKLTSPARMVRGFFRCLRENGFAYTINRIGEKLKKNKKS